MKRLRMENGDVVDVIDDDEVDDALADLADALGYELVEKGHRLADAEPAEQPADAPRDDNDDPIFDNES